MKAPSLKAGVIGAGAWGTALAQTLAADGRHVRLWALEPEVVAAVNGDRQNPLYLPHIPLSASIEATGDMAAMADRDLLLIVSPAQHLRTVVAQAPAGTPLVLCSKGIEAGTSLLMSEVAMEAQPTSPIAVLSGPTFAHEVARGLPTAITLACADAALAAKIAGRIARPAFRPYLSDDVVGAEIGGAVKNVLAIACGVAEGAGLGLNARASLISRGFAEMTRFGLARAPAPKRWLAFPDWAISSLPVPRPTAATSRSARGWGRGGLPATCWPTAGPSRKGPLPRPCCGKPPAPPMSKCPWSRRSAPCWKMPRRSPK